MTPKTDGSFVLAEGCDTEAKQSTMKQEILLEITSADTGQFPHGRIKKG